MKPIEFSDGNFDEEVLKSEIPVVVDFWAAWCAPCRMIAPIIEDLSTDFEGKAKVGKLDVDSNQQTAIKYGVRSIPTVLIIKNGEVVDTIIGALPKAAFVEKLQSVL